MKLALDTNAYTALAAGTHATLNDAARGAEQLALPIIVVGELRFGFMNGSRAHDDHARLDRFLVAPRVSVLSVSDRTAWLFGEIATLLRRAGTPIQQDDMWIAALCKEHGFTLATRDRGLQRVVGLDVFDFDEERASGG